MDLNHRPSGYEPEALRFIQNTIGTQPNIRFTLTPTLRRSSEYSVAMLVVLRHTSGMKTARHTAAEINAEAARLAPLAARPGYGLAWNRHGWPVLVFIPTR